MTSRFIYLTSHFLLVVFFSFVVDVVVRALSSCYRIVFDVAFSVGQVLQKLPDKISVYPNMNSKTTRLNPGTKENRFLS